MAKPQTAVALMDRTRLDVLAISEQSRARSQRAQRNHILVETHQHLGTGLPADSAIDYAAAEKRSIAGTPPLGDGVANCHIPGPACGSHTHSIPVSTWLSGARHGVFSAVNQELIERFRTRSTAHGLVRLRR